MAGRDCGCIWKKSSSQTLKDVRNVDTDATNALISFCMKMPLFLLVSFLVVLCPGMVQLCAADWLPIEEDDLKATESVVDPGSGVEILFKELQIDDAKQTGTNYSYYVRLKIFNDQGVEDVSKIDVTFGRREYIRGLRARSIAPDGTITNLDRDTVYTREIVRKGKKRQRAQTFALPGLVPGSIVEYQWTRVDNNTTGGLILHYGDNWPARHVKYMVRPFSHPSLYVRTIRFKVGQEELEKDRNGFYTVEVRNVPALRDEPYSPPEDAIYPWMLFYYSLEGAEMDEFWENFGRDLFKEFDALLKPRKEIQQKSLELTEKASDKEQALRAIYTFCTSQIRNTTVLGDGSDEERADRILGPSKVLAGGAGTAFEINLLFGALARAAGFEASLASVADRSERFFDRSLMAGLGLPLRVIAVKLGDGWRFYDPGSLYVPFGSLKWENEGVDAIIALKRDCPFTKTQITDAATNRIKRTAALTLDEEGGVEGVVTMEYGGQFAAFHKSELANRSAETLRELVGDEFAQRFGHVELSDIVLHNEEGSVVPFRVLFRIKVDRFADRAGRRMFLQPSFFKKGGSRVFSADEREFNLYFPYYWSESDDVTITLPEGYELEEATAPVPLPKIQGIGYTPGLKHRQNENVLLYTREFDFSFINLPQKAYGPIKDVFEVVYEQDNHTVTLKKSEPKSDSVESGDTAHDHGAQTESEAEPTAEE